MNTVLKTFLSMSLSGALLILALFVGKRFWRDKISRQWQYYIWILVILRLLLPFTPERSLMEAACQPIGQVLSHMLPHTQTQSSLNGVEDAGIAAVRQAQDNEKNNSPTQGSEKADSVTQGNEQTDSLTQTTASERLFREIDSMQTNRIDSMPADFDPFKDITVILYNQIWLIWLAVASGMLIRKITMYQGFARYIKAGLTPVTDIEMLERLSANAQQAGIRRPVELCVNPLVSSPMLMGFFRPCIILPGADISEKDFHYIALHELIHHKRQDILYKWLVQLTVCLHWFNPMVYLMRREITKACEFSCDEAVLAKVGDIHAPDYGKTLLDAMAAVGKYRESFGAVTLSENKQLLKERLGAIMSYRKKSRASVILTGMMTMGIVLAVAFMGVYPVAAEEADGIQETRLRKSRLQESSFSENRLQDSSAANNFKPNSGRQENDIIAAKAEQYYEEGSLPLFWIAFSRLSEDAKAAWLERIYADEQIQFLGLVVNQLEVDSAAVQQYAERAYADRSTARFSIMAKRMSEKTLRAWLDRALADEQFAFQSVLFGLLDDEELDALEEELDRQLAAAQMQEYLEHGILSDGKTYYYESQLVHIFLDIRKEGSFYTLQVNPQGTVNVKVTRDEKGGIKSVGYMTEAEVEALFGSMDTADEEVIDEIGVDEKVIDEIGAADADRYFDDMGGAFDAFNAFKAFKIFDDYKCFGDTKDEYDTSKYSAPQIIAVNEQSIAAGAKLWFGDYDLCSGDQIRYDIEAETGSAIMIGFVNTYDSQFPDATYHSALVHRDDGVLKCTQDFICGEGVKAGQYKLYVYAPEDTLRNVKGSVSIAHAQ
ncbi:MAG: M56 family metallopeptidase [Lachnospiraceae bacterium]|nr:M56 family metallopeptidase [Lachnospiraceae bacterium]